MADRTMPERLANRAFGRSVGRTNQPRGTAHILVRLDVADYLSVLALLCAWTGIVFLLSGEPNWAVVVLLVAFGFDKLDGFVARRYGLATDLGRQLDAFVDVFAYLVSGALLFHVALSPTPIASVVVGFCVVCFGGLRLIRFTSEGFRTEADTSYYRGITVVHVNVLVLVNYLLAAFVGVWNGWLAAGTVVLACPLMVSEYKSYKTVKSQAVAALAGVLVAGLCLALEFGVVPAGVIGG
ncbi:phosphatidylcholine/phosphatidylserine synthase [Halococcus sp. IIIV-5B]|uniref:CDP-alcohol phosphatidyltransferase family protein n=1 Tax=Halococcus sp. IIIV-5B TaxID=2321230 RepID=UPI0018F2A324|nr:CDP-alcohol phosphatidyltransferase family protein [Halococcus sp. IIIV-5B]